MACGRALALAYRQPRPFTYLLAAVAAHAPDPQAKLPEPANYRCLRDPAEAGLVRAFLAAGRTDRWRWAMVLKVGGGATSAHLRLSLPLGTQFTGEFTRLYSVWAPEVPATTAGEWRVSFDGDDERWLGLQLLG